MTDDAQMLMAEGTHKMICTHPASVPRPDFGFDSGLSSCPAITLSLAEDLSWPRYLCDLRPNRTLRMHFERKRLPLKEADAYSLSERNASEIVKSNSLVKDEPTGMVTTRAEP